MYLFLRIFIYINQLKYTWGAIGYIHHTSLSILADPSQVLADQGITLYGLTLSKFRQIVYHDYSKSKPAFQVVPGRFEFVSPLAHMIFVELVNVVKVQVNKLLSLFIFFIYVYFIYIYMYTYL